MTGKTLHTLLREAIRDHFASRTFKCRDFYDLPGICEHPPSNVARALNCIERYGFIERVDKDSKPIEYRALERQKVFSAEASLRLQDVLIGGLHEITSRFPGIPRTFSAK